MQYSVECCKFGVVITKIIHSSSAPMNKSKNFSYLMKYGIPLVITVGLCYLLFRDFDFNEMIDIIRRECDFRWIGAALVVSVFSHIFRAMRWGIQLRALGIRPPLFALVLSIFGTYAVNLVFPRLGELWRTGYIAQRQQASFAEVFGSMVADRLADSVTVVLLTLATFLIAGAQLSSYIGQNPDAYAGVINLVTSPVVWGALVALIVVAVLLCRRFRDSVLIRKLRDIVRGLWQGFAVVAKMPGRGRWLLLTFAIWGCYFSQLLLAFFAFPLTASVVGHYGVVAVLVCFVLSSISMGVPSNGGIGPWQWAIVFGLSLYSAGIVGLTKEYATTFANLVMGMQTMLLIVLGIFTFICITIDKRRKPISEHDS